MRRSSYKAISIVLVYNQLVALNRYGEALFGIFVEPVRPGLPDRALNSITQLVGLPNVFYSLLPDNYAEAAAVD